jgi:hypothetical protein
MVTKCLSSNRLEPSEAIANSSLPRPLFTRYLSQEYGPYLFERCPLPCATCNVRDRSLIRESIRPPEQFHGILQTNCHETTWSDTPVSEGKPCNFAYLFRRKFNFVSIGSSATKTGFMCASYQFCGLVDFCERLPT